MHFSLFCTIVLLCGQLVFRVEARVSDLPLLSDRYDIDDYLVNHQNQAAPWTVSNFPNIDSVEQQFVPIFNGDYPTLDVDTTTNHLGNVNHIKNQFGNIFIPSVVDNALNSLMNSDAIRTQSVVRIANQHQHNDDKNDDDDDGGGGSISVGKSIDHIRDAVSIHKPFGGYKKQTITSVQRPINLNVSPHPLFVPISHAYIYPVHLPIAKPTKTIKDMAAPVPNFTTATTDKYVLPYHASYLRIVPYKKSPFLVQFSHPNKCCFPSY